MFCQKCGAEMERSEKVCQNCGSLQGEAKFCQHCGEAIDSDCVICPKCGKQVQQLKQEPPQVVINNTNTNTVTASATAIANGVGAGRAKNKWIALCLCIFFGLVGAHKFYEGKIGMGILYLLTGGLFVIGAIVDTIVILMKPNPYYV
jgi:RNA polymerase subunit RPABC4/transcription elongation factor Spt4